MIWRLSGWSSVQSGQIKVLCPRIAKLKNGPKRRRDKAHDNILRISPEVSQAMIAKQRPDLILMDIQPD
jgi:hypothetical protein